MSTHEDRIDEVREVAEAQRGGLDRLTGFFLENPLLAALLFVLGAGWGVLVAPFDFDLPWGVPRDPVAVDAIPDTGDNQQIVFVEWPGRSPRDVEDQVTYPLTVALLGVPGVKTIRSSSMFGFASVFVVFEDEVEFYWSRSRILEKLSSLPAGTLPEGVQPALGPDATALGQVFWYTLEGRDEDGRPAGGWDLQELRSVQDWLVRYSLSSVPGVSEVASIGGFVKEYQIDVDPDSMRVHGVTLEDVFRAIRDSNVDVGARTIELNRAEYVVRGLGLLESVEDIEETVVGVSDNVPITIRHIARVGLGPALRRGALDKDGTEAVGGVVVSRHGANPMEVIQRVKARIEELAPGLPEKTLADGRTSRVTVVPFYDRSGLIRETLGTLSAALGLQLLVTALVTLVLVAHLRSALAVALTLPLAVLLGFVAMKAWNVEANIVALSGIAIAVGTVVDVGIVLTDSVRRQFDGRAVPSSATERLTRIRAGVAEVSGSILTAVTTTVVGFLPVFALQGAEGKLFRPLAFTKSFVLVASIVVALLVLPALMRLGYALHSRRGGGADERSRAGHRALPQRLLAIAIGVLLAFVWEPLGPGRDVQNVLFTALLFAAVLIGFQFFLRTYSGVLRACLEHKRLFLAVPAVVLLWGSLSWLGAGRVLAPLGWLADRAGAPEWMDSRPVRWAEAKFPGLGREFMPALDEGSFLLMPVAMSHASIGESLELLQQQDRALRAIPEVEQAVGKIGRVESALDPAPVSMVETVIRYRSEYRTDEAGRVLRFAVDEAGEFVLDEHHELVPDEDGRPFRQWRDHIQSPRDIWSEIERAADVPGMTRASMLQPIETRQLMLQTGLRAPMGVKLSGPDIETLDAVALDVERALQGVPSVRPETVLADRVIGKPYLEIDIDRSAIARFGLSVRRVQDVIEVAIGGKRLTTMVHGRERYPVRARYLRELRERVDELERILVAAPDGTQIPLGQLASLRYTRGPQSIRSEDTFPVAYVLFDRQPDRAEVDVVEEVRAHLDALVASGELTLPSGVTYRLAGQFENQVRAAARLSVLLPLTLLILFTLLYLQFRSVATTGIVFTAVFVAWAGGFVALWLVAQPGFLDVELFGRNLRDLFQLQPVNLSVAVWVGFLALFGIATDDGVLMAATIDREVGGDAPGTVGELRATVVRAGEKRIRACLTTTATTVLALLPVLTSTGRGADIMLPMALPVVGGMLFALITILVVPVLHCAALERRLLVRNAG